MICYKKNIFKCFTISLLVFIHFLVGRCSCYEKYQDADGIIWRLFRGFAVTCGELNAKLIHASQWNFIFARNYLNNCLCNRSCKKKNLKNNNHSLNRKLCVSAYMEVFWLIIWTWELFQTISFLRIWYIHPYLNKLLYFCISLYVRINVNWGWKWRITI